MIRLPQTLSYGGFIFDLDGTVYRGERLMPGAAEVIAALRERSRGVVYLSNKAIARRADYARKLTDLGIPTDASEVVNSSYALARYLQSATPQSRLLVIGEAPLVEELLEAGLHVTSDPSGADYVVVSWDRTFSYDRLNAAFQAVLRGAKMVATNADRACPVEGGLLPDAAAMIGALEASTGRRVERVVGKPSVIMLEIATGILDLPIDSCLLVGDRLETDIRMGQEAGMDTALVLTGASSLDDLRSSSVQPRFVLNAVGDLLHLLRATPP